MIVQFSIRRMCLVLAGGLVLSMIGCQETSRTGERQRLNVLFLAADDLRPALNCYGNNDVFSPHLDRLAETGLLFERAYCQYAVCCPSRSSLMTGLRPDSVRVYNNSTHFRDNVPDVVTLPQFFRKQGYHTQALGKIYHSSFEHAYCATDLDDPISWSVPSWFPGPRYYYTEEGMRVARMVYGRRPDYGALWGDGRCIHNHHQKLTGESITDPGDVRLDEWTEHFVQGQLTEAPDVPDQVLYDGQVAERAIQTLSAIADRPFFLAVGFLRPHSPYVAPKKYWELYDPKELTIAENRFIPRGAPEIALLANHDHYAYRGAPGSGPLDDKTTRHLTHGYYACVSYVDAQVGKILHELDRLGLSEKTIVIFWGDHGYHLGENSRWGKQTCFEVGTRSPLIIRVPQMPKASRARALVEFVDIYPSLCELAGLPLPEHLEGNSFAPLLKNSDLPWKGAAFSQYPRPVPGGGQGFGPGDMMGYSMRTDRYRFTEWKEVVNPSNIVATELYDHDSDPFENLNLAEDAAHSTLIQKLQSQLEAGWQHSLPPEPKD